MEEQGTVTIDDAVDMVINTLMEMKKVIKTQGVQLQGMQKLNAELAEEAEKKE